jgi:hypothetical protein
MTTALDAFAAQLRADPDLMAHADAALSALEAVDLEGDGNPDAATLYEAVLWIVSQRVSADERVKALCHLLGLPPGPTRVNLRRDGERIIVRELS